MNGTSSMEPLTKTMLPSLLMVSATSETWTILLVLVCRTACASVVKEPLTRLYMGCFLSWRSK